MDTIDIDALALELRNQLVNEISLKAQECHDLVLEGDLRSDYYELKIHVSEKDQNNREVSFEYNALNEEWSHHIVKLADVDDLWALFKIFWKINQKLGSSGIKRIIPVLHDQLVDEIFRLAKVRQERRIELGFWLRGAYYDCLNVIFNVDADNEDNRYYQNNMLIMLAKQDDENYFHEDLIDIYDLTVLLKIYDALRS